MVTRQPRKHRLSEPINKILAMWLTRCYSDHYHKHIEHKQTYRNSVSN